MNIIYSSTMNANSIVIKQTIQLMGPSIFSMVSKVVEKFHHSMIMKTPSMTIYKLIHCQFNRLLLTIII